MERNHKNLRKKINEKEIQEIIAKINKTKGWFFQKINKTDKPLAKTHQEKREKT